MSLCSSLSEGRDTQVSLLGLTFTYFETLIQFVPSLLFSHLHNFEGERGITGNEQRVIQAMMALSLISFLFFQVDSAKPFGENSSKHHSQKSRRKSNFSNFPFPMRRASSLDSLAANVKVIKEPDERIVLRNESPSPLDSSKFGKPSPSYSNQGDADFHQETSFATSQHSRTPSPLLDQPLLRERFSPGSQSTWKKIHERVCSLLTSHRAQQHLSKVEASDEIQSLLTK
ncbi:Spermatogenesis associated 6-like protein [Camelus dromedarius]|uniref:Spermatogenesis associated 6-like protein n=1 Tax=Camelus dromedarius TaxID=9838 RepID=A0A5N4EAS6_CAMDR|nr:Spermatogenesis associated 6-like protein [Camelus dromedarius]